MPFRIDGHRAILEERRDETKWPQFGPLLSNVACEVKPGEVVVDSFYCGSSLFAPFFENTSCLGVDRVIPHRKNVYVYKRWIVADKCSISVPTDVVADMAAVPIRDPLASGTVP